jgi:hypothetical protein
MVLIQDVYRYLLRPVENKLKAWEAAGGVKTKIGRFFRIGKTGPAMIESMVKFLNNYYMWLHFVAQRSWGPLYKRLFEFDMHPTKISAFFYTHLWFYAFWLGNYFHDDLFNPHTSYFDPDYLAYYILKYQKAMPFNTLNWRTSAHYLEIDRIYSYEMMARYQKLYAEVEAEHERKKTLAIKS